MNSQELLILLSFQTFLLIPFLFLALGLHKIEEWIRRLETRMNKVEGKQRDKQHSDNKEETKETEKGLS